MFTIDNANLNSISILIIIALIVLIAVRLRYVMKTIKIMGIAITGLIKKRPGQ